MSTQDQPTENQRTKIVKVRYSESELLELDNLRMNTTRAKFIRERSLRIASHPSAKARQENKALAIELTKIGNNLNQIARAIHTENLSNKPSLDYVKILIELKKIEHRIGEIWQERL